MEIKDGVARINASYGLKLPTTDAQYGSEDAHLSITIEYPIEGEFDALKDRLLELEADLITEVKLAVFAQMDVEAKELPSGVIAPDLGKFAAQSAKSNGSSTGRQASRSSGGRGGKSNGGRTTSQRGTGNRRGSHGSSQAVDKSGLPRVELEYWHKFDEEMKVGTFIDQRSLKEEGIYKPGAADFVEDVPKGGYQLWLYDRDGNLNEDTADALDAAGVEYSPFPLG